MVKLPDLETTFLLHLVVSLLMLGIVVITQIIVYPIFPLLDQSQLRLFQFRYLISASFIYGIILIIELLTGIYLIKEIHNHDLHSTFRTNLTIIGIIWGISLLFDLPAQFSIYNSGFNSLAYRTILAVNLTRVILYLIKCRSLLKITRHMFKGEEVYHQEFL